MIMRWNVGDACYVAMLTTTPPVHTISLSTAMTKTEFLVPKEKVFETNKQKNAATNLASFCLCG